MVRFSFSSFYMSLLFANFMILLLYLAFRNQKLMMKLGLPMLSVGLCITMLRMLLPFEVLPMSHNINLPGFLSMILSRFMYPRFFKGLFSYWSMIKTIWLGGIIFSAIRCLRAEYYVAKLIETKSKKYPEFSSAYCMLRKIQQEFPKAKCIDVRTFPSLQVPMIYGFRTPHILLPEDLDLNDTQLYYILRHEISHYLHNDMLLKVGVKLLCIIYWWNPFCKLLQEQTETILEMRTDQTITDNPIQKIQYLECLLFVAKHIAQSKTSISTTNAISFCDKASPLLKQRFSMLLNTSVKPLPRVHKKALILLCSSIFVFSFLFIFEADYMTSQDAINTALPSENNSYFIERADGKYDLYLDEEYIETIDSIEYYLNNIPIYKQEDIISK